MTAQYNRIRFAALAVAFILALAPDAQAYIGPGAGFAVAGSFLVMFGAILAGLFALITWPIRYAIRSIRGQKALAKSRVKRFVILGLDGMDPQIAEKMLNEGKLKNFSRLAKTGCFKRLSTTVPAISPVAWSSFQTGANPGKHNIFDFLTRDKKTYMPRLSSVDIRGPRRTLKIGKYQFPLGKADIRLLRKGKPFWKTLGEHGIFSSILRVPITFPPEKFYGVLLSGMCVPDLRGTQGMFSYYTTKDTASDEHTGGERYHVERQNGKIIAELVGPDNPFVQNGGNLKCHVVATVKNPDRVDIKVNGNNYTLNKGEYSPWIKVDFKAGAGVKVRGICKFLLKAAQPEFELYVTPINIDPEKPAMPIAHPSVYSVYLAKLQGSFATLGLAEDSWALNEKVLDDNRFMDQCVQTDREREEMFFDCLDKVKQGLCVCVFDGTDRIQHTFWRDIDPQHPVHDEQNKGRKAIEGLYERMDALVGKTIEKCTGPDTVLMVISDHGFNTFRHGIDLNRWLLEKGYLKLKDDGLNKKHLTGIDWSQTRAYAVGLAGIFLNIKGRESQGIVQQGPDADKLRQEIASELMKLTDPQRENQTVIKNVYNALKVYTGPYKTEAPDLIVGYNKGYRASWETAIGQVTEGIFHDNTKAWSGDHCMDPVLVPGVFFCNRQIENDNPRLMDIGPTVLDMFGVAVPKNMDGRALKVADETKEKKKD